MAYTKGSKTYTFVNLTAADATEVNKNFDDAWNTEFTNIQANINANTGSLLTGVGEFDQSGTTDAPIRLTPQSSAPTTTLAEGELYFDSTNGLQQYLSSAWVSVGSGDLQDAFDNGNTIDTSLVANGLNLVSTSTSSSRILNIDANPSSNDTDPTMIDMDGNSNWRGSAITISRAYTGTSPSSNLFSISDSGTDTGDLSRLMRIYCNSTTRSITGIDVQMSSNTGAAAGINIVMSSNTKDGLDVTGRGIATGGWVTSCPFLIEDGLDISNYGGINGGQIVGRDVLIAMSDNLSISGTDVVIPEIVFNRLTKKTITLEGRNITIPKERIESDGFRIPTEPNEHLVDVIPVTVRDDLKTNKGNKGIRGTVDLVGDFKFVSSTGKVRWKPKDDDYVETEDIELNYVVRVDSDTPDTKTFTIQSTSLAIPSQPAVVYLEETVDDETEICEQDTAAMTPNTSMEIHCVALADYEYNADTYVLGMILNDKITQYIQVI